MIPRQRSPLNVKVASHAGLSGKENEDRYAVCAFELEGDLHTPSVLAVVADGIGGHRAGEVAAELATESICQSIAQSIAQSDADQPVRLLEQAVMRAGEVIAASAESNSVQYGMGTTCACAWVIGDQLYIASVGDSRIYLVRGKRIQQLTTDHTWVQEAINRGAIQPEEARSHPNAHVIRRYLGSKQPVVPDLRLRMDSDSVDIHPEQNQGMRLLPGDVVLLCTDGLTDLVQDEEILEIVGKRGAQAGVNELVNLANWRGGHDNITIVTLGMPGEKKSFLSQPVRVRYWRIGASCLAGVVILSAMLLVGTYWFLGATAPALTASAPLYSDRQVTLFPENRNEAMSTPVFASETAPATLLLPGVTRDIPYSTSSGTLPAGLNPTLTPWPTNTP